MITEQHKNQKDYLADLPKIAKGAGITLTGNIVGKGMVFLYTIFLARFLGANDVGLYFLGITIVRLLAILSIVGLDVGIVRYIAIHKARNDLCRLKGTVIVSTAIAGAFSLILAGLIFVLGDYIATVVFHKPYLVSVIRLLAVSIPFESLMKIFLASTRGLKLMQYTAYVENLAWVGFRFLSAGVLLGLGFGLQGVVLAYVISSIVAAGLAFYYSNKHLPLFEQKVKTVIETRELVHFSVPMVFTTLIFDLMSRMDIFMLGLFVSSSDIGIYTVSLRLVILAQVIFMAFQPIFQPIIAELHDKKQFERLCNLLKVVTQWCVTISFPVFLSLLFFPEFFLHFFGNEFLEGSGSLTILAIAFMISTISNLPAATIFMSGRSDLSLKNNMAVLIINTIFNYILIPRYGIVGAAFSTGISFVILALMRIVEVYVILRVHPFRLTMWKPVLAGSISVLLVLFFLKGNGVYSYTSIFILLLASFTVYFFLIYVLRLDDEEIYIGNIMRNKILSIVK